MPHLYGTVIAVVLVLVFTLFAVVIERLTALDTALDELRDSLAETNGWVQKVETETDRWQQNADLWFAETYPNREEEIVRRIAALCQADRRLYDRVGQANNDLGNMNVALAEVKKELNELFGRVVCLDETCEGEKALRADLNQLGKVVVDKFRGVTSCNDILLTWTRRNEDLLNQLNSRLSRQEREVQTYVDGLSDQLNQWVADFTTRLDNLGVRLTDGFNLIDRAIGLLGKDREKLHARCDGLGEERVAFDRSLADYKGVVNREFASLQAKVKLLEEFARLDLADIRSLKEKVNTIIPEVMR